MIIKKTSPSVRGALFYLFFFLSTGSITPFLNIFYMDIGFTGREVGYLSVFFPMMTVLFATPISALADRKGWRIQILQVAIIGSTVFIFLLKFPTTFILVAVVLMILAILFSPIMSIADSLIANMAEQRKLNYGGMRLWGSIGFAVSATVFGILWQRFGLSPMFLTASLMFFPIFFIARSLNEGPISNLEERKPLSSIGRDPGLVILMVISFFVGIATNLSMSFEGIYMHHLGGGNMLVGLMIGVSGMGEMPMMNYGQKIADRLGGPRTLLLSFGLMCAAYLGYALVFTPWMLVLMAGLKGMGFGLFFSNIVRIVYLRAPAEWVTTAQSLRSVAMFGLAPLLASPLGGVLHDMVDPSSIFLAGVFALGLAMVMMIFAKNRNFLN